MSLLYKGLESSNHLIQVIDIKQTCKPEKECVYNMNVSGRDFFILCGFVIHMSIPILQVSLLVMPKLGILTFCPHLRLDVWYVAFVDIWTFKHLTYGMKSWDMPSFLFRVGEGAWGLILL